MKVFFGDERHVGPGHADSNFQMASDTILSKVPLQPRQIHRIKGEYPDTAQAAVEYEATIQREFGLTAGGVPPIYFVFLGMWRARPTLSTFPRPQSPTDTDRI